MKHLRFSLGILALLLTLASCKPDVEACFSYAANDADVTFASTCSIEAAAYDWDFGDGSTSIAANPVHTYSASGNYIVTLKVTDKKGHPNTISQTITVVACAATCVHGQCVSGACVCDAGYEGIDCGTALNAKFSGTYSLTETCNPSGVAGPYSVTVSPGSSPTQVTFVGLYEVSNISIVATVNSDGVSFTIARQQIFTNYDIECSNGVTTSDGHTINMTYQIYSQLTSSLVDQCTATLAR
jgi:PKD repeat protein